MQVKVSCPFSTSLPVSKNYHLILFFFTASTWINVITKYKHQIQSAKKMQEFIYAAFLCGFFSEASQCARSVDSEILSRVLLDFLFFLNYFFFLLYLKIKSLFTFLCWLYCASSD